MIIPITEIPPSIVDGLRPYRDLFPRVETFVHLMEYATGLVVLEKPSIRRLSECLIYDVDQSCINKMMTQSPWDGNAVNERRLELISPDYKGKGLIIGILDTTLLHHPRSKKIYAADKYWDYVDNCYTTGIQIVTSAISVEERCDGFDYRIYHRFHQEAEEAYLQHTSKFTRSHAQMISFLASLLGHIANKQNHKTKHQLTVEMVEEMEKSELAPGVYVVDSSLFAPVLIDKIESYNKPWVADSEVSRILYDKGKKYNLASYEAQLPDEAFREITTTIHGDKKTFYVFTKVVRIHKYGKVRLAIIYRKPNRQGNPIFCFTNQLYWEATRILKVRTRRWDIEPLHEQAKQFLGAEASQLQNEKGVRRHLTLVFVVNSLLQSMNMEQPIAGLSMQGRRENSQWTFGQRCLRIILEVFESMINKIKAWFEKEKLTSRQIFERLFKKMCQA